MEKKTAARIKPNYPPAPPGGDRKDWEAEMRRVARLARESAGDMECSAAVTDAVEGALAHLADFAWFQEWLESARQMLGIGVPFRTVAEAFAWESEGSNRRDLRREVDRAARRLLVADEIRPAVYDALCDLVTMGDGRPRQSRHSTPLAVLVPTDDPLRDGRAASAPGVIAWVGITALTTDKELRVIRAKLMEGRTPVRGFGIPAHSPLGSYVHREKTAGRTSAEAAAAAKVKFGLKSFIYADADRNAYRHRRAMGRVA